MSILFGLAVVAVIAWVLLGPPASRLTIRVRRGEVQLRGAVPEARRRDLLEFFGSSFPAAGDFTVRILEPRLGRRPGFRITGDLTPGEVQQIRNYLHQFPI